jgi:hypothetical protein
MRTVFTGSPPLSKVFASVRPLRPGANRRIERRDCSCTAARHGERGDLVVCRAFLVARRAVRKMIAFGADVLLDQTDQIGCAGARRGAQVELGHCRAGHDIRALVAHRGGLHTANIQPRELQLFGNNKCRKRFAPVPRVGRKPRSRRAGPLRTSSEPFSAAAPAFPETPSVPRPMHRLAASAPTHRKCAIGGGFRHRAGRFGDWIDGTSG